VTKLPAGATLLLAAASILLAALAPTARAATTKEVNDAIDKAVKYLYDVQQGDNWELVQSPTGDEPASVRGKQWGGLTAMATYALLAAGQNPQDERVARAVTWLLTNELNGTYAIGLRAQVWQFLPEKHPQRAKIRAAIKRDMELLLSGASQRKDGSLGFYGYFAGGDHYDRSNSQYGVLGTWAVEQAGAEIPTNYWKVQEEVWQKSQNQDGGWGYSGDDASKPTMAAAGIATLFITQDYLLDMRRDCQGNYFNQHIEKGLAYLDRNIGDLLGGNYYGMYGVERIGVASGRKYFGGVDWYTVGSDFLVKNQGGDGAWGGEDDHANARKIPNTCFALYFLTRGRAPILMNKLDYSHLAKEGKDSGWNQRPRDLANFSRWMTRNLDGRFTNWQIVTLKAQPQELHDAPILYIAGSEPFTFPKDDVAKLRQFVEEGGLILGNADCGNAKFAGSFRALGRAMYPEREFRDLEPTHVILSAQQFSATRWKRKPRVQSLGNGVREQMILVPTDDLSKAWQLRNAFVKEELYQLPANIFLYLVRERPIGYKGDTWIVRDSGQGQPANSIRLARIQYPGNWDPEPGGWRRLATVLKNTSVANLSVEPVTLGQGKLKDYKVAHLTGTTKVKFNEAARKELKAFTDAGGTLIIDAAGGSADFTDTVSEELSALFGPETRKALGAPLSPNHPLYTLPELAIQKFEYRNFARGKLGRLNTPRLAAIESNGRVAAFFSRDDLSGGLVAQPVDGILGYASDTATDLMRNLLVYAQTDGKGFPPKPKDPPKAQPAAAKEGQAAAKPADAKAGAGAKKPKAQGAKTSKSELPEGNRRAEAR
jgi:hypothetical protein